MTVHTTFAPGFGPFCKPVKPVRRQKASVGRIRQCLEQHAPASAAYIAGHAKLSHNYVTGLLRDLRVAGVVKRDALHKYHWAAP